MPFTGSHPAAVLPLLGTPLPASALVIGSTAPDLPYYLPGSWSSGTHSLVGLVTIDLLLGLVAWLVWHGLLSAPALSAAPRGVRARLVGRVEVGLTPRLYGLRDALWLVAALVIGAATHVGWDEFTHPARFGTHHVPALARSWYGQPGWEWAQFASGVGGGLAIVLWLAVWWRRTEPREVAEPAHTAVWVLLLLSGTAVGTFGVVRHGMSRAGFVGATWGGATVLVLSVVAAAFWHAGLVRRAADDRAGAAG